MGLLSQAEKRKELLDELTKKKKKYIDVVGSKAKKAIFEGIKEQRDKLRESLDLHNDQDKVEPGKKVKDKKDKSDSSKKVDFSSIIDSIKHEDVKQKDKKPKSDDYVFTGIDGFDKLLNTGIPKGSAVILAGGAGSGKTIMCLQTLAYHASKGKKCLYMSFEESEDRLIKHMEDFGWKPKDMIKKKNLMIKRINPFEITRNVDALLAQQKGELLIDVNPVILPDNFKNPDVIVIDSLTAIGSAFTGKDDSYRIYIEQLFRFLEKSGATSFLISETEQIPKIFSQTGVEEFLADGVIVLYAIKHENVRENAIEILKLRGAAHQKKIVAMQITDKGIVVYPDQEVFSEV